MFNVHAVENLSLVTLKIFHVHEGEKVNQKALQHFMSKTWTSLTGEFYDISCPWGGKV